MSFSSNHSTNNTNTNTNVGANASTNVNAILNNAGPVSNGNITPHHHSQHQRHHSASAGMPSRAQGPVVLPPASSLNLNRHESMESNHSGGLGGNEGAVGASTSNNMFYRLPSINDVGHSRKSSHGGSSNGNASMYSANVQLPSVSKTFMAGTASSLMASDDNNAKNMSANTFNNNTSDSINVSAHKKSVSHNDISHTNGATTTINGIPQSMSPNQHQHSLSFNSHLSSGHQSPTLPSINSIGHMQPSVSLQEHQQHQQHQQQQQQQQQPQPQPQPPQRANASSANASPSNSVEVPSQESADADANSDNYRPLNVKDALSYLEQVKIQFNHRPNVYNSFLDIMKEFKAQTIDTPGVIERVSTLFAGYPSLIQGFNTFLPQGYKIEYSNNPNDPNPVKVVTPYTGGGAVDLNTTAMHEKHYYEQQQQQQLEQQKQLEMQQHQQQQQQQQLEQQQLEQQRLEQQQIEQQRLEQQRLEQQRLEQQKMEMQKQQEAQTNPAANSNGDVEFSQAINYVNKIKTRFQSQPDIYKKFLEILQTYQREQKPIREVYEQVTVLFQNAPDLLDDFKKFLPETPESHLQEQQYAEQQHQLQLQQQQLLLQQQQAYAEQQQRELAYGKDVSALNNNALAGVQQQPQLPPLGSFSPPSKFQKEEFKQPVVSENVESHQSYPLQNHIVTQGLSNDNIPVSNLREELISDAQSSQLYMQQQQQLAEQQQQHEAAMYQQQQDTMVARPEIDLDPSLIPVVPEPLAPVEAEISLSYEATFFEKVKKFIGNKPSYGEFMKILNLYTQDLLTKSEIVYKVEFYIGSNAELMTWFKQFVGFEELPKHIENIVHEKHKLDLDLCEAYGPSYKRLPKADTFMPCSGRDEMCWEVLNDEWVGHPVWASEESGFIAHRKNQYEEALFKTEEERHEYDFYIEANLRTIQTLETIANRILNMTPEEKENFKLPPGLGHTSVTIYKKVIRKVYDKERGFEIIDALHEHPALTVPVVLKRLKQKDEEWRRMQREWNKVWREVEQKVYYKSLDHLGLTFKQSDKKLLTSKQLLAEISTIKLDQQSSLNNHPAAHHAQGNGGHNNSAKRSHPLTPKSKPQLDYSITDYEVLYDIVHLCRGSIYNASSYSYADKDKLLQVLVWFLSTFFGADHASIKASLDSREGVVQNNKNGLEEYGENGQMDNILPADEEIINENGKRFRETEEDSRSVFGENLSFKEIISKSKYKKLNNLDDTNERELPDHTKETESDLDQEIFKNESQKPWIHGTLLDKVNENSVVTNRTVFNAFTNTNIYIFLRFFITAYERLVAMKEIDAKVTSDVNGREDNEYVKDMTLSSAQLADMGLDFKGTSAYKRLLELAEDLIDGKIEHQWFEESLRQAYRNKAFKLYTIDKVIQSIVKHAHTISSDNKTCHVMELLEKDRMSKNTSFKEQILYRLQVRNQMSPTEPMFRIGFDTVTKHLCIEYVAVDGTTVQHGSGTDEKWKNYITSFALSHPTEGVLQDKVQSVVLDQVSTEEAAFSKNTHSDGSALGDKVSDENEKGDADAKALEAKNSISGVSYSDIALEINKDDYTLQTECGSQDVFSRASVNKFPRFSLTAAQTVDKNETVKTVHTWLDASVQNYQSQQLAKSSDNEAHSDDTPVDQQSNAEPKSLQDGHKQEPSSTSETANVGISKSQESAASSGSEHIAKAAHVADSAPINTSKDLAISHAEASSKREGSSPETTTSAAEPAESSTAFSPAREEN